MASIFGTIGVRKTSVCVKGRLLVPDDPIPRLISCCNDGVKNGQESVGNATGSKRINVG